MKKITKLILSLVLVTALSISGLTAAFVPASQVQAKTGTAGIQISEKKATIVKGQKHQLKVTGTKNKVTWSTTNKKVATVSKKGVVTAKKKGNAVIKAKVGKKTLKCTVKVVNVGLNYTSVSLYPGNSKTLKLLNYKKKVTWKSKNTKVCTVTSSGKIKAKKAGKTKIIATAGGKKYTCNIVVACKKYKVGDTVEFGKYWQNDTNGDSVCNKKDAKQPIIWRILSVDSNGNALLLADEILDCKPYNDKNTDVTWETCTLRTWLNGTSKGQFLGEAFTSKQRSLIKKDTVVNSNNPKYGTSGGKNTTDRIFLLSIDEMTNTSYGFISIYYDSPTRETSRTWYAYDQGLDCSRNYWLRSPGSKSSFAAMVLDYGGVDDDGFDVDSINFVGVRPALRVNLNAIY